MCVALEGERAHGRERLSRERVRPLVAGAMARTCALCVYVYVCMFDNNNNNDYNYKLVHDLCAVCACGARRCRKRFFICGADVDANANASDAMSFFFLLFFACSTVLFYKFNSTNYYIIAHTKRYIRNEH